jgi:hypothetical protein
MGVQHVESHTEQTRENSQILAKEALKLLGVSEGVPSDIMRLLYRRGGVYDCKVLTPS